jgi:DNA-binding response OmpR family regulator
LSTGQVVLLVEDDEAIRQVLSILLSDDYRVVVAEDGAAALREARQFRPKVVVLDLVLPKVDGIEVARQLRADARTSGAWIVGISGEHQIEPSRLALLDEFLPKPLDIAMLEASVRRGLTRGRVPA